YNGISLSLGSGSPFPKSLFNNVILTRFHPYSSGIHLGLHIDIAP
ncbi:MAG: hypothetical protein RIS65_1555, partial [Pseudomonadota bacterium]